MKSLFLAQMHAYLLNGLLFLSVLKELTGAWGERSFQKKEVNSVIWTEKAQQELWGERPAEVRIQVGVK